MNSKAGMAWLFYPLIGPPNGLVTFVATTGIWSNGVGIWLYSYLVGGIQGMIVGICAGVYGVWRGNVPFWVPVVGAVFSPIALFLFNFEELLSRDPLGDPLWFTFGLLFGVHLVPAIVVWLIIRILWGPGRTWTPETI
jgi:hypothetical protein